MKNKILTGITGAAYLLFLLAATAVDSDSNIPIIICFVCSAWMGLFVFANRDQLGPLEDYEDYEEYEDYED